jgi:16S rRNA (cytidine1402-2'-O)-methyltransferase
VHRIVEVLGDLCDSFGDDRPAFVGRELTKMHEQCVRGTLGSLRDKVADKSIVGKGEFVVVVAGSDEAVESSLDIDRLLEALSDHLSARDAARVAAEATGGKRNDLYKRLLLIRKE